MKSFSIDLHSLLSFWHPQHPVIVQETSHFLWSESGLIVIIWCHSSCISWLLPLPTFLMILWAAVLSTFIFFFSVITFSPIQKAYRTLDHPCCPFSEPSPDLLQPVRSKRIRTAQKIQEDNKCMQEHSVHFQHINNSSLWICFSDHHSTRRYQCFQELITTPNQAPEM